MTDTPSTPEGDAPVPSNDPTSAYDMTPGATAGYPPAETIGEQPRTGAKRGVVIGVGAAVLAIVAAAGVYATTALSGGGRQPDDLAPQSTFAYVKVDLDPAANQKLAAREFFGKFPALKKPAGEDGNVFESLLEQMFEGEEDISYQADIKPWFDKRAAFAAFKGSNGKAATVGILQSKDDGKARAAMDKVAKEAKEGDGDFAYKIDDGYVVVGGTQADVDDAVAQAEKGTIDDNQAYAEDVDRLDGDQVAVGWVDIKQAFDSVKGQIPDAGLIPNSITDLLKGRLVTGLHLTGDYAELTGYAIGLDQQAAKAPANDAKLLKDLPGDTVAAISINGLGENLKTSLSQLAGSMADPEALLGELGLSLDGDVLPLLGDQTVIALGGIPLGMEDLAAGLVSAVKDGATAKTAGEKIAAALEQTGVPLESDVSGNTFYLATPNYLGALKGAHGLGSKEQFAKAMGDLGSVSGAMYVDLGAVLPEIDPEAKAKAGALKSLGITSGYEKGVPFFRVRVVAL